MTHIYGNLRWQKEQTLGCIINDLLAVAILIDLTLV